MSAFSTDSTGKIREKKKRFLDREQRIIDKALELLLRDGVDRVTVAAIAEAADIGKGTVYKHFQSKSEILIRIILDYQTQIAANLQKGIEATEQGDPGATVKAYFNSRLSNPALDRLASQLELRLDGDPDLVDQMQQLREVRRAATENLNQMVVKLIERGVLEDVPPHYHYLACWALSQGAVDLCFDKGFREQFGDTDELLKFIINIGATMGNKGQLRDL